MQDPWLCKKFPALLARAGFALARHGGDRGLVDFVPDPAVAAIVGTWPARFDTSKAAAMGFPDACSIDDMIQNHIEDELN